MNMHIGANTRQIPDWQIIMTGTAGRLGKQIPVEAFTALNKRPLRAAALLLSGGQPLVIWREKACFVRTRGNVVYSVMEWQETGIYFNPSRPHTLYFVRDGNAYEVETGVETRRMIFKAHRAVLA